MADDETRAEGETQLRRWEELRKIRNMPISIAHKRALKAEIAENLPVVKIVGRKRILWYWKRVREGARRLNRKGKFHVVWQKSLQDIEVRGGVTIVNVFLFIKWAVYFNLLLFLIVLMFVILPYMLTLQKDVPEGEECPVPLKDLQLNESLPKEAGWAADERLARKQWGECCVEAYYKKEQHSRNNNWKAFELIFAGSRVGFGFSPLTYGFYNSYLLTIAPGVVYDFRKAYLLIPVVIFVLSLFSMIYQIGSGIKELTLAREGEFYKFSNLIFAGWDHFTKDKQGASFKKKILLNEMRIALKSEKLKVVRLSKKQKVRLFVRRIFANVLVGVTILLMGALIYLVADYSISRSCGDCDRTNRDWTHRVISFLPPFVISICNLIFPILLKHIRRLEQYSHEVQTTLMLIRALVVRVLAIGFAAVKYYSEQFCEKDALMCKRCKQEKGHDRQDKDPCWESLFGIYIYLIVVVDLAVKAFFTFVVGYGKVALGRLTNKASLLTVTKFNIIRHSLDIIYIQSLAWFFYFAPFLPFVVAIYCIIMAYMKKFTLMVLSQAVPDTFRTTKTTTVYVATKLIAFVAPSLTIGYVMTSLEPSRSCGPFRGMDTPWSVITDSQTKDGVRAFEVLGSPGFTIPILIVVGTLSFYFYASARAHSSVVDTLRHMLILEGHDKQYLFARLNTLRDEADKLAAAAILKERTSRGSAFDARNE